MRRALRLAPFVLALACGPTEEPEPIVSDPLDPSSGDEGEVILPSLRRLGRIGPGDYLFRESAVGREGDQLMAVELIETRGDAFVVSVEGGPHREVPKTEGWPMACLRAPVDFEEGDLRVHLDEGAPVFVLASGSGGARVSVALDMEHSEVVHATAIDTSECPVPTPEGGESARVTAVSEGDRACLFPDQETLDETAGLAIPSGVGAALREEDDEWVRVRVSLAGGWAQGWAHVDAVEEGAPRGEIDWDVAAIGGGRCLMPGRSDLEANTDPLELRDDPSATPMIPPENIERVIRQGEPQINACYQARLNEVPDLAVTLEVQILVDPDGRVDDVALLRGGGADDGLTVCVREVIGRWRFYPPRVGAVQIRRTFALRPPSGSPSEP